MKADTFFSFKKPICCSYFFEDPLYIVTEFCSQINYKLITNLIRDIESLPSNHNRKYC